jgi:hypothetical protein
LVWSDAGVRELASKFIPAADEVNVILWQRGSAEREFFTKVGKEGHYGAPQQGIYAMTPGGKFLGSTNERDAKAVAEMLKTALAKWDAMDKKDRLAEKDPAKEPQGRSLYPEGGLVLQAFSRDLPRKDGGESKGYWVGAFNQDYAWFTKDEAKSVVPASPKPGAKQAVAEKLVRRLARCHLTDNVRGESRVYEPDQVKKAEMTASVTKVEGELVHLRLEGAAAAEEKGNWKIKEGEVSTARGYEMKLLGLATWDAKKERFTTFDLVAAGNRWGGWNPARTEDLASNPMGVVFRLAPGDSGGDRVPPAFVISPLGEKYFKQ